MLNLLVNICLRFFQWWIQELLGLLPQSWRTSLGSRKPRLVVTLSGDVAHLLYGRPGNLRQVGSVPLQIEDTKDDGRPSSNGCPPQLPRAQEMVLQLPRSSLLRCQVELPLAALENLREVLAFEMDRHTPFRAEDVYFDYRLLSKNPEKKHLIVELVVVTRAFTDKVLEHLRSWNINPDRIDIEGDETFEKSQFNLLPDFHGGAEIWRTQKLLAAATIGVCVLLATSLYLPLHKKRDHLSNLQSLLSVAKSEATEADRLKGSIDALIEQSHFVIRQKRQRPPVVELLAEVTKAVPDNTWIIQLSWLGDRLTLSGYSANPSSLIGVLEDLEMFSEVQFDSPVTVDQRIGLERFNLSAKVLDREES